MPSLDTPPNPAETPTQPAKVRTGRFGELEHNELIHLLDTLDDERSKASFRESIYISVIVYLILGWFLFYGPRVLFHQPRIINPADAIKQNEKELTYLDVPKDLGKLLPKKPADVISDKDRVQQTAKPTIDRKTLQQLQAMRRPNAPGASIPAPRTPLPSAPTPQPSAPQPQQAQQPPPTSAPQPLPRTPQPTQQALADAPRPTRPNFGNPSQTAGDAVRQAAEQAARNRGQGGDYGAGIPVAHQGMNTGVDILSDTMGVNFGPYMQRILREIYNTWIPLIPEEARPPLNKQGTTQIRFTILPDGRIGAMHLDGSTHDDALNRAAWGSIVGVGQFPPLPSEFHGPNLELRIHYLVNKQTE